MANTVWLASYPKSGNTWLRAVYTAWHRGEAVDINDLDGGPIASGREPIDGGLAVPSSDLTPDEVDLLRPRADELLDPPDDEEPRLRKAHDGFHPGPAGEPIVSPAATSAALYVVRDPRDVAVSLANHAARPFEWAVERLNNADAAYSDRDVRLSRQLRQRLGSWSDHVRSWVDDPPFPVHVLRYEDCLADPVETFTRALRFAGLDAAEGDVATAVDRASFAKLRAQEQAGGFKERPHRAEVFFRRGEAGSWRQELPAPLAQRIASEHADVMSRFGYGD